MINITVQDAVLTRDTEIIGRMDPYVVLNYGGQRFQTSVRNEGGQNPSWGEQFTFQRSGDTVIRVQVWEKDSGNQDDLVGQGQLNIAQFANSMMNSSTSQAVPLTYQGKSAGTVNLGVMVGGGYGVMGNPMGGMPMQGQGQWNYQPYGQPQGPFGGNPYGGNPYGGNPYGGMPPGPGGFNGGW